MSAGQVRALEPADTDEARALVHRLLGGSRHAGRVLEQLAVAIAGADAECMGLVLREQDRSPLLGVVLFGPVAGASGVIRIHALVGVDRGAMAILVDRLILAHQVGTARLFVCEIADDAACAEVAAALYACAFRHEGRVDDFYADSVNLDLMVRRR